MAKNSSKTISFGDQTGTPQVEFRVTGSGFMWPTDREHQAKPSPDAFTRQDFETALRKVSSAKPGLATTRARELAEDVAASKREAEELRGKSFGDFRTVEEFEQDLEG